MKNDITDSLSAATLIALISDGRVFYGPSWLRVAASAYRADRTRVTRPEFDRRWAVDGEVLILRPDDDEPRFLELTVFDEFQAYIFSEIARAFR